MQLLISDKAAKELRAAPQAEATRMLEALTQMADGSIQATGRPTPMLGQPSHWRLQVGEWRAIYFIDGEEIIVTSMQNRLEAPG